MRTRRSGNDVLFALIALGLVAAVLTALAGFVLAGSYRPHSASGVVARASAELRRSDRWRDGQLWAGVVFVVASSLVVALAARRRSLFVMACAAAAALAALVALLTRELVAWDQLALRSVTVGTDVHGYWTAAFDNGVRFVLVEGTEVSQATYGADLLVHLGAPVLGAVALLTAAIAVRRAPPAERTPAPTETYAGAPAA